MHRNPLIELLKAYSPWDQANEAQKERFLDFVLEFSDCFERSLKIGHVTGSAWILNSSQDKALLTHHRKLNRWMQLGGHADGDSNIFAVVLKEAREESGIIELEFISKQIFDIDIHEIPERGNEPKHFHYDVRLALKTVGSEVFVPSDESHALAWVDLNQIETLTNEPSILRMRDKCLLHLSSFRQSS